LTANLLLLPKPLLVSGAYYPSEDEEANSIKSGPKITDELHDKGELISVEILNASAFLYDMESIQFKMLQTVTAEAA
jgi:hypothetical protein